MISELYGILTKIEEQNESQTIITETKIEEWLEILEEVERENQIMRRKLRKKQD